MSEIRVNTIVAAEGTSAPNLPYGVQIPTGMGITGAGGLNITGIITAANFDGTINTGAAGTFGGVVKVTDTTESTSVSSGALIISGGAGVAKNLFVGDTLDCKDINVSAAATIAGALSGSTGTFSGAVNVDATTDSTSATSGALIVDGGLGVAKNVYIGAGLSVAGTLTYEDVTNVDSVGVITAKSGVNISGGELLVGSNIKGGTAGVLTATTFVGAVTGNVTGNASGSALNVTQAAQTAITSVGTLTGLTVNGATSVAGGGEFKVGTGVTIASTSGVATFSNDVWFNMANGSAVIADHDQNYLFFGDNVKAVFGNAGDLDIYHDGSHSYIEDGGTGHLYIESSQLNLMNAAGSEYMASFVENGSASLFYDNVNRFQTTGAGTTSVGISTVQEFSSMGMLKERVKIVANKLSAATNIDVKDGNVYYFSTNETTTATPNIRYDGSHSLNNKMLIGETISVSIIYKPNGAGYYAALTVDGSGVTEEWNGGAAPSAANAGGYDVLTHTLVKTADATFLSLANVSNFA